MYEVWVRGTSGPADFGFPMALRDLWNGGGLSQQAPLFPTPPEAHVLTSWRIPPTPRPYRTHTQGAFRCPHSPTARTHPLHAHPGACCS